MSELFVKILNMSISASWLILTALIFRLVLKKAPKWVNVLLWGIVAIRLICPFSIESTMSLIPESVGNGELVSAWMDDYIGEVSIIHDNSINYDAAVTAGREPIYDGNGGYYVVTQYDRLGEPSTIENTVIPFLATVWAIGVALLFLYTIGSYIRLQKRVNTAIPLRDKIYQSENVNSPFVFGIIKPKIYLPFDMEEQDINHVIAHEQAHIHRKDHWWKPLGFLLLTVHWFNPLMWLAYVLLCRDIELACDEKVIKGLGNEQRADYTQALLACSINRRTIAVCPLAFGEIGVKERVKSVMNYKKPAFWIVVAAVIVCVGISIGFLTDPVQNNPEDKKAEQTGGNNSEASTLIVQPQENESINPVVVDGNARQLYAVTLRNLLNNNILPDGSKSETEDSGKYSQFAVADVDADGAEELVLLYDSGVMADAMGYIIGYDTREEVTHIQLEEFPFFAFLENGNLKALSSHNQTYGEMWPYALYQYLPESDSYKLTGYVYAEDKATFEANGVPERYPDAADISDTGTVYYVGDNAWGTSPIDEADYMAWLGENHGNAAELEIEYLPVTEEAILTIENTSIPPEQHPTANGSFENIMGFSGHWTQNEIVSHHYGRTYYAETAQGKFLIAESFGYTIDDYICDFDGDGITELICNVTYGDGAERIFVYRLHDGVVEKGYVEWEAITSEPNIWGINGIMERYDNEQEKIVLTFTKRNGDAQVFEQSDYANFEWEEFASNFTESPEQQNGNP